MIAEPERWVGETETISGPAAGGISLKGLHTDSPAIGTVKKRKKKNSNLKGTYSICEEIYLLSLKRSAK